MLRAIVFDWGDTIMRTIPGQGAPMAHWPRVEAIAGVGQVLRALHPTYHLALATNARDSDAELVQAALRRVGLVMCFDSLLTARDLEAAKPDSVEFKVVKIPKHLYPPGGTDRESWRTLFYANLISNFVSEILSDDDKNEGDFLDGARVQEVINAVELSFRKRRWISLPLVGEKPLVDEEAN